MKSNQVLRLYLILLILGIVLIASGIFVLYYSLERRDEMYLQRSYSFGTDYYIDYPSNTAYLSGGSGDFNVPIVDAVTILPIRTPVNFSGDIGYFSYLVWDGGVRANIPENKPDYVISAADLPFYYTPSNRTVSFELVAYYDNVTRNSIIPSNEVGWEGTFIIYHVTPANFVLLILGLAVVICGGSVLSITYFSIGVEKKKMN